MWSMLTCSNTCKWHTTQQNSCTTIQSEVDLNSFNFCFALCWQWHWQWYQPITTVRNLFYYLSSSFSLKVTSSLILGQKAKEKHGCRLLFCADVTLHQVHVQRHQAGATVCHFRECLQGEPLSSLLMHLMEDLANIRRHVNWGWLCISLDLLRSRYSVLLGTFLHLCIGGINTPQMGFTRAIRSGGNKRAIHISLHVTKTWSNRAVIKELNIWLL